MNEVTSTRLRELLSRAPGAVESFHPGHWALMERLEQAASNALQSTDQHFIEFLVDITFLKQPYRIDTGEVSRRLASRPADLRVAREALASAETLDYRVLEVLARLPYFGRHGGRSFGSAVLRIVLPARFGIIDWRNLAVLCGAPGFEGLIDPASVSGLDPSSILQRKGRLEFTSELYREYNERLRRIALDYSIPRVADVDLALWVFSIDRSPFVGRGPTLFETVWQLSPRDRVSLRDGSICQRFISSRTGRYIAALDETGTLSRERVQAELRAVFSFVKNECNLWGSAHPYAILQVLHTSRALDEAIETATDNRLLEKWRRWEGMVDPASFRYKGASMPSSMIVEGFIVFEDLIPIREHFESFYDDGTFEAKDVSS